MIYVIGGLGYLGSALSQILERNRLEHEIIDCGMFNTGYEPKKIRVHNKNIVNVIDIDFQKEDTVFVCSDIDIEDFYECGLFDDYVAAYVGKLNRISEKAKMICFYDMNHKGKYYKDFVAQQPENATIVPTPMLFGDNFRVRNDTLINDIIKNFTLYQRYVMDQDPFEVLSFCELEEFAIHIVSAFKDPSIGLDGYNFSRLPRYMICTYLQWYYGLEYQVIVNTAKATVCEFESTSIRFENIGNFNRQIDQLKKAVESGLATRFLNDSGNNQNVIQNYIDSYDFMSKLNDVFSK